MKALESHRNLKNLKRIPMESLWNPKGILVFTFLESDTFYHRIPWNPTLAYNGILWNPTVIFGITGHMYDPGWEVDSGDQRKPLLKGIPNTARARLARVFIKESNLKYSTCKTSVGVNFYKGNPFEIFPSASIFQRNPLKNFFHLIFFPGKSLVKNSNFTFNFT